MDPLSIAAGVAGLITLTAELSRALVAYGKAVKREREDLQLLLTEVSLLQSLLQRLDSFLRSSGVANVTFHQTSALEASLAVCKATAIDLNERLRKLEAAGLSRAVERFKWPFSEKEVVKVLETLRRCISTFQFSLTLEGW
ncbi:hypothetical protein G7Y79_00010g029040 [Physcia stellaris]|nr:hypothetical protein G7Y79_00010g029040 [Physcia stellaris]